MFFYSSSFQDIDLLRDSVIEWNLEVFPLEVRSLGYEIKQAVTSNFLIGEGNFSCKTEQRGATPKGFRTFVIPANDSVHYNWRGRYLHGNCLSLFPENGELQSISNHTFHVMNTLRELARAILFRSSLNKPIQYLQQRLQKCRWGTSFNNFEKCLSQVKLTYFPLKVFMVLLRPAMAKDTMALPDFSSRSGRISNSSSFQVPRTCSTCLPFA